jgi:hypothetical protein
MGDSRFAGCLQGGGVHVEGGTVTITSSSIYGNFARNVRAHPQKFPMPRWENCRTRSPDSRLHNYERFDQLKNVHAAKTLKTSHRHGGKIADARSPDSRLHNYERFDQLQAVRAAKTLKTSHRPDGKMADTPKSTLI